jgi:hypothetical protein
VGAVVVDEVFEVGDKDHSISTKGSHCPEDFDTLLCLGHTKDSFQDGTDHRGCGGAGGLGGGLRGGRVGSGRGGAGGAVLRRNQPSRF